jgi:hypothetical protein
MLFPALVVGDDFVGWFGLAEGFEIFIMHLDVATDFAGELDGGSEYAAGQRY